MYNNKKKTKICKMILHSKLNFTKYFMETYNSLFINT